MLAPGRPRVCNCIHSVGEHVSYDYENGKDRSSGHDNRVVTSAHSVHHDAPHAGPSEDDFYEEYESLIAQKAEAIVGPIRGVDVFIADSSDTTEEYPMKVGWGHNTFEKCIAMAKNARAKKLFFTHHEPNRTDDQLEEILEDLKTRFPHSDENPEFHIAQEGLELEV